MKKTILYALACIVYAGAVAQIEVSNKSNVNKWVMAANELPGGTGRILIDNPSGSVWTIYIYAMSDGKYITSYAQSNNKGVFVLLPGEYKITLNNVPVLNVPVQKGYDTKIKCGILETDEAVWYLHDEAGNISYTSGNKSRILLLPVGNYTYKIGEGGQRVIVKAADESNVKEEVTPTKNSESKIIDAEKWVLVPMEKKPTITPEQNVEDIDDDCKLPTLVKDDELDKAGTLFLDFEGEFPLLVRVGFDNADDIVCSKNTSSWNSCPCPKSYTLKEGTYDIRLNYYWIKNVPILANYETILKTGSINSSLDVPWASYNLAKDSNFGIRSAAPVPVGTYMIFDNSRFIKMTIKDKQTYDLSPPSQKISEMQKDSLWTLKPIISKISKSGSGRLKLNIDPYWDWSLSWKPPGATYFSMGVGNTNVPVPYIDLTPGIYTFRFCDKEIPDVPINSGMETKIKFGYLDLRPINDNVNWKLRDRYDLGKVYARKSELKEMLVLPANLYIIELGDGPFRQFFFVSVEDGKTTAFEW